MMTQRNLLPLLAAALMATIIGCGGSDVVGGDESSDGEAIGNIITIDRPEECNIDIIDFSVPDTTSFWTDGRPYLFWKNKLWDSLVVTIQYDTVFPDDPYIPIPAAYVIIDKDFGGTFEYMGKDTVGGETTFVRYSKPVEIGGHVLANFLKYGLNHNFRRGWLLNSVGHARIGSSYAIDSLPNIISLQSETYGTIELAEPFLLTSIPRLYQGDSVTVIIDSEADNIIARIRYPGPIGYLFGDAQYDTLIHKFYLGFRVPNIRMKGHIVVEQFGKSSLMDPQDEFRFSSTGILFRTY